MGDMAILDSLIRVRGFMLRELHSKTAGRQPDHVRPAPAFLPSFPGRAFEIAKSPFFFRLRALLLHGPRPKPIIHHATEDPFHERHLRQDCDRRPSPQEPFGALGHVGGRRRAGRWHRRVELQPLRRARHRRHRRHHHGLYQRGRQRLLFRGHDAPVRRPAHSSVSEADGHYTPGRLPGHCPVGFGSLDTMETVLNRTNIGFLSLSRPLLREPDLPEKFRTGKATAAKCISCNRCYSSPSHRCVFRKAGAA